MDPAKLINNGLKCLNRWLEANKITINADKSKYTNNKNVNLPIIKIGNNKFNEDFVTKFLGIHLDKKLNFVKHISKRSIKVEKSI